MRDSDRVDEEMNNTYAKTQPLLWLMVYIVAAGGIAWSAYLISEVT